MKRSVGKILTNRSPVVKLITLFHHQSVALHIIMHVTVIVQIKVGKTLMSSPIGLLLYIYNCIQAAAAGEQHD